MIGLWLSLVNSPGFGGSVVLPSENQAGYSMLLFTMGRNNIASPSWSTFAFFHQNWSACLVPGHSSSFSLLVPLWLPWCLASRASLMGEELGYKLQMSYLRATGLFYSPSLDFPRAVSKSCRLPRYSQALHFAFFFVNWRVLWVLIFFILVQCLSR